MDQDDRRKKLQDLDEELLSILQEFCLYSHIPRKDLADRLNMAPSTMFARLQDIGDELGLDNVPPRTRQRVLVRDWCPVLRHMDAELGEASQTLDGGHMSEDENHEFRAEREDGETEASNNDEPLGNGSQDAERTENGPTYVDGKYTDIKSDTKTMEEEPAITYVRADGRDRVLLRRAIMVGSLVLGVVAILLALNLFRQPEQAEIQTIIVTSTALPPTDVPHIAQADGQAAAQPAIAQATYTPYPTSTPAPTYTPYPSPTDGQLPTGTPRPTYTPYPTRPTAVPVVKLVTWTPVPRPTEPEITPRDAILEIGDWWKQDSMWVRLATVDFDDRGRITIELEMWNKTGTQVLFTWSEERSFALEDNLGHKYKGFGHPFNREETDSLSPSERTMIEAWNTGSTMMYEDNAYFGAAVTDMWFTVTEFSRISHAKWHISVPK